MGTEIPDRRRPTGQMDTRMGPGTGHDALTILAQ